MREIAEILGKLRTRKEGEDQTWGTFRGTKIREGREERKFEGRKEKT